MDKKYTWDLEALLSNKSLDDLYDQWIKQNEKMISIYKKFVDSEDNFIQWLSESEKLEILSNRLMNYVTNNMNEDIANPKWISWSQKLRNKDQEFSQPFSDFSNRILANEPKIRKYLENKQITEYKRMFELVFKTKPHLLSDDLELLKTKLSAFDHGFDEIYSTLLDNDLKYADAKTSKNKVVKIHTMADVFKNLKSKDHELRKTSWLSFHEAIYNVRNTLTQALYYNYLMLNTNAKVRNFADYISRTAFDDEIEPNFINHVYDQVKSYKSLYKEYIDLRNKYLKKLLNVKQIQPWDNYLDLVKKEVKVSIEDSQKDATEALKILGADYVGHIKRAFKERWISWLPKVGKQTGAYSIGGTKGLDKYYISMNFNETLQSTYTLVHELGHSMNSYYFGQAQKIYQGCSIFYAEISSINNEMLLNYYLLDKYKNDKQMKLMILDEMIRGFFATTTRQVIFSNFEYAANDWVNKSMPFTYENIAKTYYELNKEYTGSKTSWGKTSKIPLMYGLVTPLRISHFFVGNFYVYKYAIGQIAAIIISDRIIRKVDGAKEKFFDFLKSGNALSPLDTIKLLGVDLTKAEPWQEAAQIVHTWIKEFRETINSLTKKR